MRRQPAYVPRDPWRWLHVAIAALMCAAGALFVIKGEGPRQWVGGPLVAVIGVGIAWLRWTTWVRAQRDLGEAAFFVSSDGVQVFALRAVSDRFDAAKLKAVDDEISSTLDFWIDQFPEYSERFREVARDVWITFTDDLIRYSGGVAKGLTVGRRCRVAWPALLWGFDTVLSLVRHEFSHALTEATLGWGEAKAHEEFARRGLGA